MTDTEVANVWLRAHQDDPEVDSHRLRDFALPRGGVSEPIIHAGRRWIFSRTYVEQIDGRPDVEWLEYWDRGPADQEPSP